MRPLGEQRLSAHGEVRRRPGVPDGDGVEDQRPRPASYMQNTGFLLPGFPVPGAWIGYGLGRLTDNLPTFVVLPDPRGLPYNGMGNFSPGFLPAAHQGTVINPTAPIADRRSAPAGTARKFVTPTASADGLELLDATEPPASPPSDPGDSRLDSADRSRTNWPRRCSSAAPEVLDLSQRDRKRRTSCTALDDQRTTAGFGRNCLIARRLLERGVRFVQVWSGAGGPTNNWDNHANIPKELPLIAAAGRSADRRRCCGT